MIDVGDFTLGSEADFAAIVESVSASGPQVNLDSLDLAEKAFSEPVAESGPVLDSSQEEAYEFHYRFCGGINPMTGHLGLSIKSGSATFGS